MNNDRIIFGMKAGIIGAIIQSALTYFLYLINLTEIHYLQLAGDLFLNHSATNSFLGLTVGLLTDLSFGAFWGIVLALVYPLINMNNAWFIKTIGFGFLTWIVGVGLFEKALKVYPPLENSPKSNLSLLIGALAFGIVTSWIIRRHKANL